MGIGGFSNLAVKVTDLDAAVLAYERMGAVVRDRMPWGGGERADVHVGGLVVTLFTRAVYEDDLDTPAEGFLHAAVFTDDLAEQLEGEILLWGPAEVSGPFGRRRIAFVQAPGDMRLEFMEQLEDPVPGRGANPGREAP